MSLALRDDELIVDNFAVVQRAGRMARVQATYRTSLTKTAQVRMCGNSVSPPPAAALIRAQFRGKAREAAA